MRRVIQVDADIHRKLKLLSAEHDIPMIDLIGFIVEDANINELIGKIKEGSYDE